MADSRPEQPVKTKNTLAVFFEKVIKTLKGSPNPSHRETCEVFYRLSEKADDILKSQTACADRFDSVFKQEDFALKDDAMRAKAREVVLVLDLDDTVLHDFEDFQESLNPIDWEHCVFKPVQNPLIMQGGVVRSLVCLINPTLLTKLIEIAYCDYGGIAVCTKGRWEKESIRSLFKNELPLSDGVRSKLDNLLFIGRNVLEETDTRPNDSPCNRLTANRSKLRRLAELSEKPEFAALKRVVLFDDQQHNLQDPGAHQAGILCQALKGFVISYKEVLDAMFSLAQPRLHALHVHTPLLFGGSGEKPGRAGFSSEPHWAAACK